MGYFPFDPDDRLANTALLDRVGTEFSKHMQRFDKQSIDNDVKQLDVFPGREVAYS
jgi:hypothetical protein